MTEKAIGRLEANPKWKPSLQTEIYNKRCGFAFINQDTVFGKNYVYQNLPESASER